MPESLTIFHYWVMTVSSASLCVSLIALLISWVSARRTNASVLRILEVRSYIQGRVQNEADPCRRLAVTLKNLGLPLHEVRLSLLLEAKDGSGTVRIDFVRCSIETGEPITVRGELAKGMVALFEARSDMLRHPFAESIRTYMESNRYLQIYDCGYLVQTLRIDGWRDGIGAMWNRIAHRVNRRFDRKVVTIDGRELFKPGAVMPTMRNWQWSVECFLREFQGDRKGE